MPPKQLTSDVHQRDNSPVATQECWDTLPQWAINCPTALVPSVVVGGGPLLVLPSGLLWCSGANPQPFSCCPNLAFCNPTTLVQVSDRRRGGPQAIWWCLTCLRTPALFVWANITPVLVTTGKWPYNCMSMWAILNFVFLIDCFFHVHITLFLGHLRLSSNLLSFCLFPCSVSFNCQCHLYVSLLIAYGMLDINQMCSPAWELSISFICFCLCGRSDLTRVDISLSVCLTLLPCFLAGSCDAKQSW